jgi:membrane-associated protease RseP (regulator of RpoE activity)
VQIVDTTSIDDDDDGSSDCVIVTAAFGTPLVAEVQTLRRFRDQVLLTNAPGRLLTRAYYRFGPSLARQVAIHPRLAAAVRGIVRPLARATAVGLDRPALVASLAAGVLGVGLALALRAHGRARRAALAAGVMAAALSAALLVLGSPEPRRPAADPAPGTIDADPASARAVATAPPGARRLRDLSAVPGGASAPVASGQARAERGRPPASSTSITLLDPLAPRAARRWKVTSDWIEGVLGPEGFRVTAPRAASELGIAAGDIIVSVDGHPPRGVLAVFTALQRDPDRATVTIELDRSGTRLVQVYRVR